MGAENPTSMWSTAPSPVSRRFLYGCLAVAGLFMLTPWAPFTVAPFSDQGDSSVSSYHNRPSLSSPQSPSAHDVVFETPGTEDYSQADSSVTTETEDSGNKGKHLVSLEAHIMSKCPDALDCLEDLILPVMERASEKVQFTLSYIGTVTDNDGVSCRHGPAECLGNILELCAFELYPDPKNSLGFTSCLTREYSQIPERALIEECALEFGLDFQALNECATRDDGAHGMSLLRTSVLRSSKAGVTKSCTVRLEDQVYCIRDDNEWRDCPQGAAPATLVEAINAAYQRKN